MSSEMPAFAVERPREIESVTGWGREGRDQASRPKMAVVWKLRRVILSWSRTVDMIGASQITQNTMDSGAINEGRGAAWNLHCELNNEETLFLLGPCKIRSSHLLGIVE